MISVTVPVYNVNTEVVRTLCRNIRTTLKRDFEIIVVDDSPTPARMKFGPEVTYIHRGKRLGKGSAIKQGFNSSKGEYLVFIDGDLEYDPAMIPVLVKKFSDGFDVVIGKRKIQNRSLLRWMLSIFFHYIQKVRFGLDYDTQAGLKAITRSAWKKLRIDSNGWEFDLELLYKSKKLKYNISEVPISYNQRTKTDLKATISMCENLARAVLKNWDA